MYTYAGASYRQTSQMFAASLSSGDKLYSAENLAWRKSVGAVEIGKRNGGRIEIGGEEGEAKEGRRQKRVEFHRAMRSHRRRSRKNDRVARACPLLFCPIAVSFAQPGY